MSLYTFGKFRHSTTKKAFVIPIMRDGVEVEVLEFEELKNLGPALVEVLTKYEVEPTRLSDVVPSDMVAVLENFSASFPGLQIHFVPESNNFVAELRNGDTGYTESAEGSTTVAAIANLVRDHGFVSRLGDTGEVTLTKWMTDFQYGFKRISDEILEAEMAELLHEDRGAW